MESKNKNKVIIALAVVTIALLLLLIWAFARYTTTVEGTGTAAVASWSFDAKGKDKDNNSTMTNINLLGTMAPVNGKVAPLHMAPGTSGQFTIDIDAKGSEVSLMYTVELKNFKAADESTFKPTNLKFYNNADLEPEHEISFTNDAYTVSGVIPYSETTDNMVAHPVIYWQWAYQTGADAAEQEANNAIDTAEAGKDFTCDVVVTGTQLNPTSTEPNV